MRVYPWSHSEMQHADLARMIIVITSYPPCYFEIPLWLSGRRQRETKSGHWLVAAAPKNWQTSFWGSPWRMEQGIPTLLTLLAFTGSVSGLCRPSRDNAHRYQLSRNWDSTVCGISEGSALAEAWSAKGVGAQQSGSKGGSSNWRVELRKDTLRVVRTGIGIYCPPTLHPEKPGSTSTPNLAFGQLAFLMTEQFWEILLLEHFNSRKKFLEAKAWQVAKAAILVWKKLRKTLTCQVCADGLGGQQQQAGQGQASSIFPETGLMGGSVLSSLSARGQKTFHPILSIPL